jgi:hypothetical protein
MFSVEHQCENAGCQRESQIPVAEVDTRWVAPTENEDGTPLADLAGYRLYWGRTSGGPYPNRADIESPAETSYTIAGLADGEWYLVMTAVTDRGVESEFSNEVSITLEDGRPVRRAAAGNGDPSEQVIADTGSSRR